MTKLLGVLLLISVAVLSGCGQTPEECQSFEYYENGYCRDIMSHCSFQCDEVIDDYRDSDAENEAVNGCLDRCFGLYQ